MKYKTMVRPSNSLFMLHNNEDFGICATHIDEQYVFVQHYDFVPEEAIPADVL